MKKALKEPAERRVIDAAEGLFADKGYPHTTMEALAKTAGISVGTLYNVFDSKEAIYAAVALRIGTRVLSQVEAYEDRSDPEEALLDAIRARLFNFSRERIFFLPFFAPDCVELQPLAASPGPELARVHQRYVEGMETLLLRCCAPPAHTDTPPLRIAACLEGILHAFMGYWSEPLQPHEMAPAARQIRSVLLRGFNHDRTRQDESASRIVSRAIHISRYDLERLSDLLEVVRDFGNAQSQQGVAALQSALALARVTQPRDVPPDIVTMNSRVVIRHLGDGSEFVHRLVFPKEAHAADENVSILSPLGTALLGRRLEDDFEVRQGEENRTYRTVRLLYQPEAAGDYHL